MKTLSKSCFSEVSKLIMEYSRPLEKSLFKKHFNEYDSQLVINELKKFQNQDGGFGHGIESDFRLPKSSPMATSIGIRLLSGIDSLEEAKEMIVAAIAYLESVFNKNRNGWYAVPKEVNDFPHAPWWHYNKDDGMTIIDKSWGNPSAEILAYLYMYKENVKKLDLEKLIEYSINYIENKQEFNSDFEIYCYIKLYEVLPERLQKRLEKEISLAIEQVIVYDTEKWHEYVPTPLDFVNGLSSHRFSVSESKINENLDFFINQLETNGKINPPWGKSFYKGDLKEAYNEWIGTWNLKVLTTLDRFDRIEK